MNLVAVTTPGFWSGDCVSEAGAIVSLLEERGFWRLHLRKPHSDKTEMRRLIEAVPERLRERLSLHDHFSLAAEYRIGGIHLNNRNPDIPVGWNGFVSRSCHSLDELYKSCDKGLDYQFLSPVFDSISKVGYRSAFDLAALKGRLPGNTVALGGVTFERLPILEDTGFYGAAMLSAAWSGFSDHKD